jgi:hypothetical protein
MGPLSLPGLIDTEQKTNKIISAGIKHQQTTLALFIIPEIPR